MRPLSVRGGGLPARFAAWLSPAAMSAVIVEFTPLRAPYAAAAVAPPPTSAWTVRYNHPAAQQTFTTTTTRDGFEVETKAVGAGANDLYVFHHVKLESGVSGVAFDHAVKGDGAKMSIVLFDAAANVLWQHDGSGEAAGSVKLDHLRVRGQLVFRVRRNRGDALLAGWSHRIANLAFTADRRSPVVAADGFTVVDSLDELRGYANQAGAKVRLKPGVYRLDRALFRPFIEISGHDSRWDLRGVTLQIDTKLFSQFGSGPSSVGPIYCVFALSGDRIELEGVTTENHGDHAGLQSHNKIINITGSSVVLRNVDLTTAGSSPWGYGSLFGISGGDVRKMNGIRIGWPANDVKLIGCRVHMRAMGHAIFVQGAQRTLIQDCHVDGLLRPTNDILAEKSGYAFDRKFTTRGHDYSEGVTIGADGRILRGEMIALSEDGIRLYDQGGPGQPTGSTTIVDCTVTQMRRGICTGLGSSADTVTNCEVRDCVATGFNVGSRDVLRNCRANARYGEAFSVTSMASRNAQVELELLDSRGGFANDLIAVINGQNHHVQLRTRDPAFIPAERVIELASKRGYAFYQRAEPVAKAITLRNETPARVVLNGGAQANEISGQSKVVEGDGNRR